MFAQTSSSNQRGTSEEAVVFDRMDDLVRFEDDGTGVREATAVIRVQSQAGVKALGQLVFGYSSATEKLDVDYVRVRKPDGRVIETPASTPRISRPKSCARRRLTAIIASGMCRWPGCRRATCSSITQSRM